MLAEQCNRFDEMVQFLEDMLKSRDKDLSNDERNLLSIAYKNSVSSRRTALRTIIAYETKEKKKETSTFLPFIQEYHTKVQNELNKSCQNILDVIYNILLKKVEDSEAKVLYAKWRGTTSDLKQTVSENALTSYKQVTEFAKSLLVLNPIGLGLALNFSVFYYEVMNDYETACKIADEALTNANKDLPNIDEDAEENRDAISIINLLKENWDMGKSKTDAQN